MAPSPLGTTVDTIDLTDHELWRHGFPHEIFSVLREEAPVWRHPETPGVERLGGDFWILSRHADVQAANRDHARLRSLEGPGLPGDPPGQEGLRLVSMDPPAHTRLRRLVSAGFTPRMTAALESRARDRAARIVERALEQGECNFVQDLAYQLPMQMIADIVGIPESDRVWLFSKVDVLLQSTDPRSPLSPEERTAIQMEMFNYANDLGVTKRRDPGDDIWTTLTTAEIEQPDGSWTKLSELELDLFFIVLVFAGSETTRGAISGGMLALLEHADQFDLLRTEPSVLATAAEEMIRWSSPVTYFRRTAVEDIEIRGQHIEAGQRVLLCYASANRDAEVFVEPFRFDVTRTPNPHLAFGGGGVHYCLGANLAKREVRVFFEEFLARVRLVDLAGEPRYSVQGIENPITVALGELPVCLTPH